LRPQSWPRYCNCCPRYDPVESSGATDLRKSFEGLSDLVTHHFQEDPLSGHLYVFTNRRKNRIKLLYFDGTGSGCAPSG
jgi:transposase